MRIAALQVSPGHNFFGHHGKPPSSHATVPVESVQCVTGSGLVGDRFFNYKPDYSGQITFFAEEVHRALLNQLIPPTPCSPAVYRRNAITRGVDLNTLIGREFTVQGVRFAGASECKPCYWMDRAVEPGTEKFLKGNGGLRARILSDGLLRVDCATAAGLLLAGGRSTRMGRDKGSLDWNGGSLRDHQAATLARSGAWPLWISCRVDQPQTPPGFQRLEDATDEGALGAFVRSFDRLSSDVVTVLAVDLPAVTPDWLERATGRARENGVSVVPVIAGKFQPFAAAWHRSALPALRDGLAVGRSLQETCAALESRGKLAPFPVMAGATMMFANLNTPQDLPR
jgi:molybdopterin-guanine dinucleotide biosynthesis protein A/MOSC domain-containing protein YiiM